MVLNNQLNKPVEKVFALGFRKTIDALDMVPDSKDRFPATDWVCANYGMLCNQFGAHVLWRSSRLVIKLKSITFGGFSEPRLGIGSIKAFQELLVWFRNSVVEFITACPQSVCAALSIS